MTLFLSINKIQSNVSHLTLFIFTLSILICSCSENPMNTEIILIEDTDYMYPAEVTKPYSESDTQIHVYIFNEKIREKIGDIISSTQLVAKRTRPSKGWGTRQLTLQYFWNDEWIYSENVTEFEDYYIVPIEGEEKREIKLKDVRFPIPVKR